MPTFSIFRTIIYGIFSIILLAAAECPDPASDISYSHSGTHDSVAVLFAACDTYNVGCIRETCATHSAEDFDMLATNSDGMHIWTACARHNLANEVMPALIEAGASPAESPSMLLDIMAAGYGNLTTAIHAVMEAVPVADRQAYINQKAADSDELSAIHFAAKSTQPASAAANTAALLSYGADPQLLSNGQSPLHVVCFAENSTAVINTLVDAVPAAQRLAYVNAPIDACTDEDLRGATPVTLAAQFYREDGSLDALIAAGADVTAEWMGATPLMWLPYSTRPDVTNAIRVLVEAVPEADKLAYVRQPASEASRERGNTALHIAAFAFNAKDTPKPLAIQELIRQGADPRATSPSGKTPLHNMAFWKDVEGVGIRALVEAVPEAERLAYIKAADDRGNTAIYNAASSVSSNDYETCSNVQTLLDLGADPKARAKNGATVLHELSRYKDVRPPALLFDTFTNVTERWEFACLTNRYDYTALHFAMFSGAELPLVQYLTETWGVDPCVQPQDTRATSLASAEDPVRAYLNDVCTRCTGDAGYYKGGACQAAQPGSYAVRSAAEPHAGYFTLPCPAGHFCPGGGAQPETCPDGEVLNSAASTCAKPAGPGLGAGAITGITVGVVGAGSLSFVFIFFVCRRRRESEKNTDSDVADVL